MRIWDRLKLLVPLLMATLFAPQSRAQQPFAFQPGGAPAFMAGQAFNPGTFQGMPQSFQSHPMISPFDNALEETFNSDGLWFNRFVSGMSQRHRFHFNVDVVRTQTRKLEGTVGDPNVPARIDFTTNQDATLHLDVRSFPTSSFPYHTHSLVPDNKSAGVKLSGGVENVGGSRFSWNISYNGQNTSTFDARRTIESQRIPFYDALFLEATTGVTNGQIPSRFDFLSERQLLEEVILNNSATFDFMNQVTFPFTGMTFDILDRNLYPYASIGYTTNNNTALLQNTQQFFDMDFILEQDVESYGSGAHFSFSPFFEGESVKARAILGGRFLRINEAFAFRGVNSGLSYSLIVPDGVDDDGDFVIDNLFDGGAPGGANTFVAINPGATELIVRSFLNSTVRSTMGGPEIGVEYDLVDEGGLQVSGATKVGVMVNTERMHLSGDNLFPNTVIPFDTTTTTAVNRTMNFFTDTVSTTHVSPLFEQSINAEIPIFSRVPVLRDIWQLQNAKLRLGWTFTWVGEVADPNRSIVWVSDPQNGIFPFLNPVRGDFYQNQLNAGINWEL